MMGPSVYCERETPRLCRGGSQSLTIPAACFFASQRLRSALLSAARDFDFGSRWGPFEGPATHKASGFAGGYLLSEDSLWKSESIVSELPSAPLSPSSTTGHLQYSCPHLPSRHDL